MNMILDSLIQSLPLIYDNLTGSGGLTSLEAVNTVNLFLNDCTNVELGTVDLANDGPFYFKPSMPQTECYVGKKNNF